MCGIVILLYLMSHLALSSGNVAPKTGLGVCTVNPENRVEGGWPGITKSQCENLGNCFDDSIPNVIWCFMKKACTADGVVLTDCACGSAAGLCTAGNTCQDFGGTVTCKPACTADGVVAAGADCSCGSASGLCTAGSDCQDFDGIGTCTAACTEGAVATSACKCGTEDCLVGDTCSEAASTCTPPRPVCDDNGCDNAYDGKEGKGICVPINIDDWNVINKDIDFSAPMKTGLCKSQGDTGCCGCFKQKLDKCEDKKCVSIPKKKIYRECFKKGEDVKPNMFNTGKMCAKRKDCFCFQNCKTTKKCKKSGGQCLGSAPEWPYQKKVKPCDKKKKCKCYIPIPT